MNQAIQFPDREEWDENKKCVCFPALVNGMQLTCAISGESLAYRFTGDTPEQWLASFRQHRWDLEEEAENLIQEQSEDVLADAGEHRVRVAHGLVGAQYVAQVHDFAILVRDFDADGGLAGNR